MIFCTSVCSNHLARAKVLAISLKKHIPDSKLIVCLVEKDHPPLIENDLSFDEVVLAKDLGVDVEKVISRYNQFEATCAVKAQLLKYAFQQYDDEDCIIYFDSDVKLFSSIPEVEEAFRNNFIIFTPYFITPPEITHTIFGENAEIEVLKIGVINAGFIGLKRSAVTDRFLDWWNERLKYYAFIDPKSGFHTDQRWLTEAVSLFDEIKILKYPGYNIALWNLEQRQITSDGVAYFAKGDPFRFFHFSHLDGLAEHIDETSIMYPILEEYLLELKENSEIYPQDYQWSYRKNRAKVRNNKRKGR
ncbi:hypothetical protein [Alkalihalobacillus sp. TS-13]|uniref:hypothetical protein n=1 Tax=Alkalihalobacillus sp. TS-13 TaxID=2842455 RepID=UPI001C873CF4|nr:hypothetical protein [Alkalihalobacillus sp. TS-13]